ncbi:sodium:proton antiporter [Kocuria dechangensis]|uniref:Sodium:proton antiporter n=1 Tax=Kocuria dechangensis TaxID=1176249 RepID=A0A917LX53_9MICC|nr:sodium:proton antiporter [Kocuria dechangensis]
MGLLDVLLGLAVVAGAATALTARRRMGAVVSFLVLGVLLAVLWSRLGAPDVALAEAAIGTGVTGALFVDAVTRGPPAARPPGAVPGAVPGAGARAGVSGALAAVLLGAGLGTAFAGAAGAGAAPGGLTGQVLGRMDVAGVEHPVSAVLLNFRSYDTLLEVVVLFVAVLSVTATLGEERPRHPAPAARAATLVWFCRVMAPVLVLVAAWVLFAGSDRPGGAFQSGAVLAGALILMDTAGLGPGPDHGRLLRVALVVGPAAFLVVAAGGLVAEGEWLALDPVWAGGLIVAVETLLALSIGVALTVVFLALGRGRVSPP